MVQSLKTSVLVAMAAFLLSGSAMASDLNGRSLKDSDVSSNRVDFSGPYAGLGIGAQFGNIDLGSFGGIGNDGGVLDGVAGWDFRRGNFVFGPRIVGGVTNVSTSFGNVDILNLDGYVVIGGRAGVVFNRALVYAHGGYEIDFVSSDIPALNSLLNKADTNAWNLGLGVETMIAPSVSLGVEGAYVTGADDAKNSDAFRSVVRLNYQFSR